MHEPEKLATQNTAEPEDDLSTEQSIDEEIAGAKPGNKLSPWQILMRAMDVDGQWFKRNLRFLLLLTAGMMLFVTNRYLAQQEMIEEQELREQLKEIRYRSLTRASELTLRTRQSYIEQKLREKGDSTLKAKGDAPYIIKINNTDHNGQ